LAKEVFDQSFSYTKSSKNLIEMLKSNVTDTQLAFSTLSMRAGLVKRRVYLQQQASAGLMRRSIILP
jgi:hypothetical protein